MLDSSEKRRRITKWLLSLFTCCILIYLGFRHISSIAAVILQLLDLAKPLLIGVMLALIFNVPMSFLSDICAQRPDCSMLPARSRSGFSFFWCSGFSSVSQFWLYRKW